LLVKATVYVDGASRGNPGPASCAAVICVEQAPEKRLGIYLGTATNNVAEYSGLILGLCEALDSGADEVDIRSDSNLCVQQVKGEFKVKNEGLIPLHHRVQYLLRKFRSWEISYVPREENAAADSTSNRVLDLQELLARGQASVG
jgi:ribonuclease HI